jgi:hypothetical protein
MSGAPTVPLAFLALYVSSKPFRVLYGSLALICAASTSYRIWLKEHLAFELEQAKNQLPRIEVKFIRLRIQPRLNTVPLDIAANPNQVYASDYDVMAELYLVNQSDIPCTVQYFEGEAVLNGHYLRTSRVEDLSMYQLLFEQANGGTIRENLSNLATLLSGVALEKGIGHRGWLRFELLGVGNTDVDQIQFALTLVDSFDGKHKVVRKELEASGQIRPRQGPRITRL